jgi:hypothetical protein
MRDGEPALPEGRRELAYCRDRGMRAVNRQRSAVAWDVQEIALHINQPDPPTDAYSDPSRSCLLLPGSTRDGIELNR